MVLMERMRLICCVLSTKVFTDGGFNLRKFVTNLPTLCQRIAFYAPVFILKNSVMEEDIILTSNLLTGNVPGGQRVLGVRSLWKLGKINNMIKGHDGQIHGAVLDVVLLMETTKNSVDR